MARDRASRPEGKPLRLFFAVEVGEEAHDAIDEAAAPLRERHPRARWVPRQNRHVTLTFLGSTWPRLVEWVVHTAATVAAAHEPFAMRVEGLGAFPNPRKARVLWAGLEDGGAMARVAADLDERLADEFAPQKRAFTPHLTIARFDPRVGLEGLDAARLAAGPFPVDRLILFRSHLRRPAPIYEPIEGFPLGAASGP